MRWITFDCFGTLVDWQTGFPGLLRPLAGDQTGALVQAYHHEERLLERERPHRSYRSVLREGLARAAASIGLAMADEHENRLVEGWGRQAVFPDVEPALAALRAEGWKLGVLTNCDVSLFAQTERAFLQPFDLVVTAEQVADYKPSLAHFHHFWRVSGVEKGDWIHAACSWYHDIKAAREVGIRSIWIDRDQTGEEPAAAALRIENAAALPGAVRQLTTPGT